MGNPSMYFKDELNVQSQITILYASTSLAAKSPPVDTYEPQTLSQ
jgi:hypothetical protein